MKESSDALYATSAEARLRALLRVINARLQEGRFDEAAVNLWRAALTTEFSDDAVLKALAQIYQQVQDIPAIKGIWKRSAVAALERGDINAFLERTYHSIYAESFYSRNPNYEHAKIDEDVQSYVRLLAAMHPLGQWVERNRKQAVTSGSRLRVGFVMEGFSHSQAPTRNYLPLAEHHDPDRFDLYFYSRFSLNEALAQREKYAVTAALFESYGGQVWAPEKPLSFAEQAVALARSIVHDQIDILVYQTTYFVPVYNLLSWLRPAPFQAQLEHQQPEHSRTVDLVFTTRKAGLESSAAVAPFPISCVKKVSREVDRASLGLPGNGLVMVSANRAQRYGQPAFWQEILSLLAKYPNAWFVALGLSDAAPFVGDRTDLLARIVTPGHRDDVMSYFAASDVYVDIFPSGGGSSVIEAISAGLPVVTFDQDLGTPYQVNSETLAEYVAEDALIAPNGDVPAWRSIVTRLIEDAEFRGEMAERMRERAEAFRPDVVADRFYTALHDAALEAVRAAA